MDRTRTTAAYVQVAIIKKNPATAFLDLECHNDSWSVQVYQPVDIIHSYCEKFVRVSGENKVTTIKKLVASFLIYLLTYAEV